MNGLTTRFGATAVKRALLLGLIGALLASFMVAQAVTATNLGTSSVKLLTESFSDDTDVTMAAIGVGLIQSNLGASAGDPGVELDSALVAINNGLTKNNYFYKFEVKEDTVPELLLVGEDLKIEVYGDDGSTTTLIATLYTQQGINEASGAGIEGVTVTVDVGSVIHNNYDIIVSRN